MLKSILKIKLFQPILTLLLVGAIVFVFFKFNGDKSDQTILKEIAKPVSFDEATNNFLNKSYQIYTRGSVFIKNTENQSEQTSDEQLQVSPTTAKTTKITENRYNDLFFYSDKGIVKRIDTTTYDENTSRYFDKEGNLLLVDNTNKAYQKISKPEDPSSEEGIIFQATQQILAEFFPLGPLLKEYKEGKFTPVERAFNLYSGKWQSNLFTSGEVSEIFLETDATTGLFRSLTIVHPFSTTSQTKIFFDFKDKEFTDDLIKIPEGYRELKNS